MSYALAFFVVSLGITNAVTVLPTPMSNPAVVMVAASVKLPSQLLPSNSRLSSVRHLPSQLIPFHKRLPAPSFRPWFLSTNSRPQITAVYKSDDPSDYFFDTEITEQLVEYSRIPQPCSCPGAVIEFQDLLQPHEDICFMKLSVNAAQRIFAVQHLDYLLKMAMEKLLAADFRRAGLIVSRADLEICGAAANMKIANAGFRALKQRQGVPSPVVILLTKSLGCVEEIWDRPPPMITLSGAIQDYEFPHIFHLDSGVLSMDQRRLRRDSFEGFALVSQMDTILKNMRQKKRRSHAVAMLDSAARGTDEYEGVKSKLEEFGFQFVTPHPMQTLTIPDGEFWLMEL